MITPRSRRMITEDEMGALLLLAALIFGTWYRIFIPLTAGFPINDGGLFYKMIEAIQVNHFRLPEYVHYNGLNIPFAYPPFAFYLAGFITQISNLTLLDTLQWLPAITLISIIPAVYFLATLVLKSRFKAGLAALLYALLPASVTWTIMGGGITRAPGQLFLVLTTSSFYLLYTKQQRMYLGTSVFFSALVCLTHPEAAVHTIALVILLWLFCGRTKSGTSSSLLVAMGTLILTSPWWITTLSRFGPAPFLSATQTSLHGLNYAIALFVPFSGEPFLTIIILLAVLGTAVRIAQGEFLLPIWYVLPFIVEPRSAVSVSVIPMALLASAALTELIFPMVSKFESTARNVHLASILQSRVEKVLFFYLLACLLIGMQYYSLELSEKRITTSIRASFEWARRDTPAGSKFLILTGTTDLFQDFTNEWFPALADRVSLTTIQGNEWVGDNQFSVRSLVMQDLQRCTAASSPLVCVTQLAKHASLDYDYVLIARNASKMMRGENLISELRHSQSYTLAYESEDVVIFELVNKSALP